jgi:hypothetical protein
MTTHIRKSVFETNSSSSHSLTLSKGDLVAQPFPLELLRAGVVEIAVGEYGWEYYRYYTTKGKLCYLLTHITSGEIPSGGPHKLMGSLCENNDRVNMLCRVVKEHTGCDVLIMPSSGYIDHQSVGVGMDLFSSDDTLRDFLFDAAAYIETGNDNSSAPWIIETDKGPENYFLKNIRLVPSTFVPVTLNKLDSFADQEYATKSGAALTKNINNSSYEEMIEHGIVISSHWKCEGFSNPFEYQDHQGYAAKNVLGDESYSGLQFISSDFSVTHSFQKNREKYIEDESYVVMVPPDLAAQLSSLEMTDPMVLEISLLFDRVDHMKMIAASEPENKKGTKDTLALEKTLDCLIDKAISKGIL